MRRATLASILVPLLCTPASAVLTVCNRTLDIANVAVAIVEGETERSEGWWVAAPNRCVDVIDGPIERRRLLLHATDVRGRVLLDGPARFCTAPRAFAIEGRGECWLRGHTIGGFQEIEAGDRPDWTVFLDEPDAR